MQHHQLIDDISEESEYVESGIDDAGSETNLTDFSTWSDNGSEKDEDSDCAETNVDEDADSDVDLTDFEEYSDQGNENGEGIDKRAWRSTNENPPPEEFIQQLETFVEDEHTEEQYSSGTLSQLDRMEERWNE